jgi:hypothetical protein
MIYFLWVVSIPFLRGVPEDKREREKSSKMIEGHDDTKWVVGKLIHLPTETRSCPVLWDTGCLSYTQLRYLLLSPTLSLSLPLPPFLALFFPFHPQLLASMDEIIINYPHMDEIILPMLPSYG